MRPFLSKINRGRDYFFIWLFVRRQSYVLPTSGCIIAHPSYHNSYLTVPATYYTPLPPSINYAPLSQIQATTKNPKILIIITTHYSEYPIILYHYPPTLRMTECSLTLYSKSRTNSLQTQSLHGSRHGLNISNSSGQTHLDYASNNLH